MPVRARHLHDALRAFCLASFARLAPGQAELQFVVEEHGSGLVEYRAVVDEAVEAQAERLRALPDARIALDELRDEPSAAIFSEGDDRALFRATLLPVLVGTAEACGGFDWQDAAFERAYADLEDTLYGLRRAYRAVAPLSGVALSAQVELAPGLVVRVEPPRGCALQLDRELAREDVAAPDAGVPASPATCSSGCGPATQSCAGRWRTGSSPSSRTSRCGRIGCATR
jgi:hypothetical protein